MDPDLQMDIITELDLVNTTLGVTQVSGLHNASKAFLFQGKAPLPLHGGRAWEEGLSGECASAIICQRVISAIILVLLSHKECSEISRMFRYLEGVRRVREGALEGMVVKYLVWH